MGFPEGDLLRAALSKIPGEGYFVLDTLGRYIAFNDVHRQSLPGYSEERLQIGDYFIKIASELVENPSSSAGHRSLQKAIEQALGGEAALVQFNRPDIEVEFEILFTPLRNQEVVIGLLGRHPVQEARRLSLAVEQVPEPVAQLADGVLNELNNLSVGLNGALETLNLEAPPMSQSTSELLEQVRNRAERARRLGRTIRSQALPSPNEEIEVDRLLVELEPYLRSRAQSLSLILEKCLGQAKIVGDRSELQDALLELVTNSSEAGAKRLTIRSHWLALDGDATNEARVAIEIKDDGEGIPRERLSRVFEPYVGSRKHAQGLGLTRVRSIIRSHGGEVYIRSENGRGTTVQIQLPASARDRRAHASAIESTPDSSLLSILVVDDAPEVRRVLGRVLRNEGHEIFEAEDGIDALEKLDTRLDLPDVIILDLMMPRMDGVETYRALRSRSEQLPILITSGYHPSSLGFLTTDEHARFLPKPFSPLEVLSALNKLLDS